MEPDKNTREDQPPPVPPQDPRPNSPQQDSSSAGEAAKPPRGLLVWVIVASMMLAMWYMFSGTSFKGEESGLGELYEKLDSDSVKSIDVVHDNYAGEVHLKVEMKEGIQPEQIAVVVGGGSAVIEQLEQRPDVLSGKIKFRHSNSSNVLQQLLGMVLPVLLFVGVVYFLFVRPMRSAGHGAMNFGKSRAKMLNREKNKVTFKDVAGIEEAQEEVEEIISFLKDPKKFQKLGGRIPKGVLLMGAPGTGKTLLARAIAGEADVPFFSISGSDFVEMFVGVGASRVRDMFEQGKKSAPCIIFIDEIDAVGRSRFTGIGGGHDEREQTLNALLVEMDGFETQDGVIIVAATNRPDVLDQALTRPGRFDRQIVIDLPPLEGRLNILQIHARKIKMAESVELRRLARGTPGFSGGDLANLLNEAALLAAREGKEFVEMDDLEEARDKVLWGRERRSRGLDDKEKERTAYHEAGHALVQQVMPNTEPLHKVTIIPRGMALGATMTLPEKDRNNYRKVELLGMLATFMGGRAAEELVFDDFNTGASMDLKQSSRMAHSMVCEWGMSEHMGPLSFGDIKELMFLGREVSRTQEHSEKTARDIDAEVKRLITDAYETAVKVIK